MRPASMLSWPSSGPMVRSSRKVSSAGSAPARSRTASSVRFLDREVAGDLARPAGDRLADHGRADDFVVQHDGERSADVFRGVLAELARARGVEPEVDRRLAVLVERGLRVDQILARHDGGLFEDVELPLSVIEGSRILRAPGTVAARPWCGPRPGGRSAARWCRSALSALRRSRCRAPGSGSGPSPWRWIVGSRVPTSSTRLRMISSALLHGPVVGGGLFGVLRAHDDIGAVAGDLDVALTPPRSATRPGGPGRARPPAPSPYPRAARCGPAVRPGALSWRRMVPTSARTSRSASRTSGQ